MTDADPTAHQARIVAAREALMARFKAAQRATPALADRKPQGTGDKNRHGMPQVPPGQTLTKKWPVLDLGRKPEIAPDAFELVVDGAVANALRLRWSDLDRYPHIDDVSDFHCVTTWSKLDMPWRGVRLADVLADAQPAEDAGFLLCHASDGYTTNVTFAEALKPDVLLAHSAFGTPLERAHGGPLRMITPQLYAWKGAKWICRIEVRTTDKPGFWEERGYSNSAHPWRNDRYS